MAQIRHDRDRSGNRGRRDAALQGTLTAAEGHEVQIRPTDPIAARLPHDVLRAVPQKKLGRVVPVRDQALEYEADGGRNEEPALRRLATLKM